MAGLFEFALIAVAFGFAFSIGAHYTGACMGMPYAARAIRLVPALFVMAPLALAGAVLASERVETTVGHGILGGGTILIPMALAIVGSAFALTIVYNFVRLPTSTIQIFVFSVIGAGVALGFPILWGTIGVLLVLWATAPFAAFAVGYLTLRFWDSRRAPARATAALGRWAGFGLVTVGAVASFAMGANDVSNASGSLVMTGLFSLLAAGAIGGVGLALGVLTWGRPLLDRVAFDIVQLDTRMATAAQFAQAAVILASVGFGYFTSMNQALVGALIGVGVARRQARTQWKTIREILVGWALGPVSGFTLAFVVAFGFRSVGWV
jgi:inorganic phosphate transporter, PiT family